MSVVTAKVEYIYFFVIAYVYLISKICLCFVLNTQI